MITLTPVIINIKIDSDNNTIETEDNDLLVTSIAVSHSINNLSEATVGLDFRSGDQQNKLKTLFPTEDNATYYAKLVITVVGTNTKLSTIKKTHVLFEGRVLGYSIQQTTSGNRFSINARGGLYQLSQVVIASPGFHPSSPYSWGLGSMSAFANAGDKNVTTAKQALIGAVNTNSGWSLYKFITEKLLTNIQREGSSSSVAGFKHQAFKTGVKAFANGTAHRDAIQAEIDLVKEAGTTTLPANMDYAIIEGVLYRALANMQMTFWQMLVEFCAYFGLTIITISDKVYVTALCPLETPVINIIPPTDMVSLNVTDTPYSSPTRIILNIPHAWSSFTKEFTARDVAMYPETVDLTTQEAKTGVKALVLQGPGFLSFVAKKKVIDRFNDLKKQQKLDGAANKKAVKAIEDIVKDIDVQGDIENLYAQYLLMSQKFKQRLGSVTTRYRPDIVPGFPGKITDPITSASFDMFVTQVMHTIDSTSPSMYTEVSYAYIRYGKELVPNPFPNALYPSFNAGAAAKQVVSEIGL